MCKNFDDFLPLGPCLVTKDEIPDPYDVQLRTRINGELKQDSNTNQMIHRIDKLVEYFSRYRDLYYFVYVTNIIFFSVMTLLPGDIILTGTPYGVATHHTPVRFLKKGDILESEVGIVGNMKNSVE